MEVSGSVAASYTRVREVFADVLAGQPGTGASFAVWHDGEWVVDLWGGYADAGRTRPWQQDTLVMPYSVTKPFAALCVLTLADRGLVDLDAPRVLNGERWRRAEVPAVNGHGTARAVAEFYVALSQGRLVSPALVGEVTRGNGEEPDLVVGGDREWGLGVGVDPDGYGMGGTGGSFGWWSEAGEYAAAFLTGHIGTHDRGDRLEGAVRDVLGLPPL